MFTCVLGAATLYGQENTPPNATAKSALPSLAAIKTCLRKFVPLLGGRLRATHADCTQLQVEAGVADFVAVCETHVTEYAGRVTEEDKLFFRTAARALKPGGYLVWGNAIPDSTWPNCV